MLVQDIMTRKVVAIAPAMPIADVHTLMEQRNIRHFPIMDSVLGEAGNVGEGERLVGIVSDRDIRIVGSSPPAAPPAVTMNSPVGDIMIRDVLTAHPLDPIEESARVLREHKIGAMPVLEGDELVGIVTAIDFLDALVAMTGVNRSSARLEIEVPNRPGALAQLLERIAGRGYNVSSVFTSERHEDSLTFVLRVETISGHQLAGELRAQGYHVVWPTGS